MYLYLICGTFNLCNQDFDLLNIFLLCISIKIIFFITLAFDFKVWPSMVLKKQYNSFLFKDYEKNCKKNKKKVDNVINQELFIPTSNTLLVRYVKQ